MGYASLVAYDFDAVLLAEHGEAVDYSDSTERVPALRVTALFGEALEPRDVGYGVLVDTVEVWIAEADLSDPTRGAVAARDTARLIRYPDEIDTGLRETWEVLPGSVRRTGGTWAMRAFRPVYRSVTV